MVSKEPLKKLLIDILGSISFNKLEHKHKNDKIHFLYISDIYIQVILKYLPISKIDTKTIIKFVK